MPEIKICSFPHCPRTVIGSVLETKLSLSFQAAAAEDEILIGRFVIVQIFPAAVVQIAVTLVLCLYMSVGEMLIRGSYSKCLLFQDRQIAKKILISFVIRIVTELHIVKAGQSNE